MSHTKRDDGEQLARLRARLGRRELIVGSASLGVLTAVGCGGEGGSLDTGGASALAGNGGGPPPGGTFAAGSGPMAGVGGVDGGAGATTDPSMPYAEDQPELVILGEPEISSTLWQMMTPYARASLDGSYGTRVNIYNPAEVAQRVVVQAFLPGGELVVKNVVAEAFEPHRSWHFELSDFLREQRVPLPFEGSLWIGATPQSGLTFMGLQAISFDWWGPAHMASVHSMRDFGNSNHDPVWTDMILPKVTSGPRYVSKLSILNASADGRSPAYVAKPEVVIRDDAGAELHRSTLPDLRPFNSTTVDVRELLGGTDLPSGSAQIIDPIAGLVAYGFTFDTDNGGIANADHFFDRHFVVTLDATELFD